MPTRRERGVKAGRRIAYRLTQAERLVREAAAQTRELERVVDDLDLGADARTLSALADVLVEWSGYFRPEKHRGRWVPPFTRASAALPGRLEEGSGP